MIKYLVTIVIVLKMILYVRKQLSLLVDVSPAVVKDGLGPVLNDDGTVNILNKRNISYRLSPGSCTESERLVLLVSSTPNNLHLRNKWRDQTAMKTEMKTAFMIANARTDQSQRQLEQEHEVHGDILQPDVPDGHRLLAYKNLGGLIWSYQHCSRAKHVGKSDDNVEVDLDALTDYLDDDTRDWEDVISCPTLCYGMTVIRAGAAHMSGDWSHSEEEFSREMMPHFCVGFLSLTTPAVAARLGQVGVEVYGDQEQDITLIEDSLITGILRERLPELRLQAIYVTGEWWKKMLTWCPFTNLFKSTFFNELIVSKISSRNNVHYIGSVSNPHVWRFYLCFQFEGLLMKLQHFAPDFIPHYVWDICKR